MAKFTPLQKIYRKIQKQFNRATKDYSMFSDGDKILVALSGGKDSLTLLQLMAERSRIFKPSISIVAAHVTMVNIPYKTNTTFLQEFCDRLGVELHIVESCFDATTDKRKSPCALSNGECGEPLPIVAQGQLQAHPARPGQRCRQLVLVLEAFFLRLPDGSQTGRSGLESDNLIEVGPIPVQVVIGTYKLRKGFYGLSRHRLHKTFPLFVKKSSVPSGGCDAPRHWDLSHIRVQPIITTVNHSGVSGSR